MGCIGTNVPTLGSGATAVGEPRTMSDIEYRVVSRPFSRASGMGGVVDSQAGARPELRPIRSANPTSSACSRPVKVIWTDPPACVGACHARLLLRSSFGVPQSRACGPRRISPRVLGRVRSPGLVCRPPESRVVESRLAVEAFRGCHPFDLGPGLAPTHHPGAPVRRCRMWLPNRNPRRTSATTRPLESAFLPLRLDSTSPLWPPLVHPVDRRRPEPHLPWRPVAAPCVADDRFTPP